MNNAQQQHQWQVLRLAAPFVPSSATSSNSVGVGPGPAELAQLWHSVVGGTHQEQMLPRGFWRQLADSPPQSSCWTPCHLISPSIVHSLLVPQRTNEHHQQQSQQFMFPKEMSVDVHSHHHQQQQHFAMDNHHNILLKPIEYSECAGGRQGVGGEAETAAVAAWMGAETNSEMDEEAVDGVGGSLVRRAEAKGTEEAPAAGDVQLEEDEPDEGEQQLLHALSPTPPARQFVHQLLTQQQQQQQQLDSSFISAAAEMFIYRRSSRLASPSKGPPPPISAERPCGTATITTEKTTTTAPVPDKMPKLERQEVDLFKMMEEQQNKRPPHSPDSGGEECENVHPPLLVAEGGADCTAPPPERPVPLLAPKHLLEMAATAITAHSQNEKQRHKDGDALRAWGALPTNCSPSSRSSSGVSTADSASLDGGGGARRMTNGGIVNDAGCKPAPAALVKEGRGRKRLAGNGPNDGVPPLRKRRRVGPRIGPRRKRRAQPAKGQGKGRQAEAATAQVLLEHGGVSPSSLKMALIRVPEQAQQLIADRSKSGLRGAAPPPLLPLVSNWRPVGPGCVRRLLPDSRDHFICYDAIRHRSVPGVAIRVGDCVQINSADNEDDLFVGRVLAINYESEGRSLQLTLLWFYTQRQLPTAPPDASGLDSRELFSSKHLDSVNVDSVDAVIHVLTFAEYCRYRAELAAAWPPNGQGVQTVARPCPCPRTASNYPRRDFLPPMGTPLDSVFFCRSVFSLTRKRIKSFGCAKPIKSLRCLRP